jgi:hypothetical protein
VEASLEERDWAARLTMLSGDIGTEGYDLDNSTRILLADGAVDAVLDGFVIRKGYGTQQGVGLRIVNAPITVRNCVFEDNYGDEGGGIHSATESLIAECIFRRNYTTHRGGALQSYTTTPTIQNCLFYQNTCGGIGGAVNIYHAPAYLYHCTFVQNLAARAPALYISNGGDVTAVNCIFWDSGGESDHGGGISVKQPEESNQGFATLSYCDVRGGFNPPANGTGTDIMDADPLFVSEGGLDFRLQPVSPCVDTGTTLGSILVDLDAGVRPVDGDLDGTPEYDMGAYEYGSTGPPPVPSGGVFLVR